MSKDADTVEISVIVNEEAMFNWAMLYEPRVEVLTPNKLRDRLRNATALMARKYIE